MKWPAVAVAGCVLLCSCSLLRNHGPVQVGQAFPTLSFQTLDGAQATLVPAAGHVTFVNVFATWCPPCKAETPDLAAFAAREASKGIHVIGIDQEETSRQVQAFRVRYHIAYPVVIDTGRETKDVLGARIIPRTIVIDGSGTVRAIVSGPMTADQMLQLAATAGAGS